MLLREQREQVVEYGKRLVTTGLTDGTFGNLSVLDRASGLMAISPSGMDYFATTPEDVVVTDLEGKVVEGKRKPSSELDLHRLFYQRRQDVNGVVHTHSTFATVLSCLRWSIEPVHYLVAYSGRRVPCIPYYPFGSLELAEAAWAGMGERYNACWAITACWRWGTACPLPLTPPSSWSFWPRSTTTPDRPAAVWS